MYPMYKYVEDFSLHRDDIEGIQYLYGIYPIKQSIIYWFLGLFSYSKFKIFDVETQQSFTILVLIAILFNYFFSGPKTGPDPTPPEPQSTTSSPIMPTKSTPSEKTTTVSTTVHVDPSQDACQIKEFDAITEIQKELHFFKDGYELVHI